MDGNVKAGLMQNTQAAAPRPMSPSRAFLIRRLKALGADAPAADPTPAPEAPLQTTPAQRRATATGLPPQTGTFTILRFA